MSQKTKSLCMGCMKPLDDTGAPCPHCNWDSDSVWDLQYLKPGTVLSARYIVGVYARKNGEGAVYIGYDNSLQAKVWIHEYFPVTLAQREVETGRISPLPGCGAQYKALMSDFVDVCNEVKRLGITEPVVPIENVLSENNTVYAIYRGLDLVSLEEYLQAIGAPLPCATAVDLLTPICNTLGIIHTHGHIHRGVSPYSIYVDPDGQPFLWDFALGATRTSGSELDCELYTGYSAPEQYSPSGWQGSWTDVYAMGAVFYRTLSGIVPPKSIRITPDRPLSPIGDLVMGLPRNVAEIIMDAMAVSTEERVQAMSTFVSGLVQSGPNSTAVFDTSKVSRRRPVDDLDPEPTEPRRPRKRRGGSVKYVVLALFCTVFVLVGIIGVFMSKYYDLFLPSSSGESASQSQEPAAGDNSAQETGDDAVPYFIGRMVDTVQSDVTYLDRFEFDIREEYKDEYVEGEIYEQFPSSGTLMPEKGTVILYVSKGVKKEIMPVLQGRLLEDAAEILRNINVTNFDVITRHSTTEDPGTVLSTYPEAGVEFDPNNQVIFIYVAAEISVVEGSQSSPPEPEPESAPSQSESSGEYYPPIIFPSSDAW